MFKKKGIEISNDNNKNKKVIVISILSVVIVLSIIVLITTGGLSKLMGNSVTEYYCEDSSYKLEGDKCVKEIKEKAAFLGDVNQDDKITNDDLELVNRYINYVEFEEEDEEISKLTPIQIKAADVSEDGDVYYLDIDLLKTYLEQNTATYGAYQENIGTKRICADDFKLEGTECIKKDIVDAKAKTTEVPDEDSKVGDNNSIDNPVEVSFKPEDEATNIESKKLYKINVIFDVKDKTKQYYYIWKTYRYGENDFSTECKAVNEGENSGNFIMDGAKKVNVSVYSDSECKNQVATQDSKSYKCIGCSEGIDVALIPENNEIFLPKDSNYKMNVKFDIKDKEEKYYYIWSNYLNGENNYNTPCTEVKEGEHGGSFKVNGYRKVKVTVYSDSSCKNKVKDVESKIYSHFDSSKGINSSTEASIWIEPVKYRTRNVVTGKVEEKNLAQNDRFIPANTDLFLRFNFMAKDTTKQYYYKFHSTKSYGLDEQTSSCLKVPKSMMENKIFTLKLNREGIYVGFELKVDVRLYKDSRCSYQVFSAKSNTYDFKYFNVKYNANGGIIEENGTKKHYYNYKEKIPAYFPATQGIRIYKNGYDLIGFKVKNSKGLFMCYTNGSKSSQNFTSQSNCNKYGYVIYARDSYFARTTSNNGETLQFIAQWTKNPVTISVTPLNYNTYRKGTHITSKVTFKVNDTNNTYYYRWGYRKIAYSTDSPEYKSISNFIKENDSYSNITHYWYGLPSRGKESITNSYWNLYKYSCKKITNNLSFSPTIRVDRSVNAGIVIVYSDSSCEYPIGSIQNVHKLTGFYRCAPMDNHPWGGCVDVD